jgi:fibronectin type 3 domain-containing protein
MKKKLVILLLITIVSLGLFNVLHLERVQASSTTTVYQIQLSRYPDKLIYGYGENFDPTGMEIIGLGSDGTNLVITDYVVEGFNNNQLGNQTITVRYQNYAVYIPIQVLPAKITNISISERSLTTYTLTWPASADASYYEVYRKDDLSGVYNLQTTIQTNSYSVTDFSGAVYSYQIRAVSQLNGVTYSGLLSDPFQATTAPGKVDLLTVSQITDTTIGLSWSPVTGATGYSIYRKVSSATNYTYCGDTVNTNYLDTKLKSGTGYQYKVCAYRLNNSFYGEFSSIVDLSTKPSKVAFRLKAGEQMARLTWSAVTGATSYEIYAGDVGSGFSLLTTVAAGGANTYFVEDLLTGVSYSYYMLAKRDYNGVIYEGASSVVKTVIIETPKATSTEAKYFADEVAFKKSSAYINIEFFRDNINFKKSYIMPGLINTNVGGFQSTSMVPQSIIFAEDYLLITAYDLLDEEYSVIYVMDKKTKELLTTLVLPTDAHVGGICYDGKSLYLTTGSKVSALWFTDVAEAVESGEPSVNVDFHSICKVGFSASYITYYNDKLWVGSYNELKSTQLYSYYVDDFDTYVTLSKSDSVTMPTRVQGIAFTKEGYLLMSRSCQLYKGLRGYMRQIDVYMPEFSEEDSGSMDLGDCLKYVYVPSMNEGIAIDGEYAYVLFESAAFQNASYKVDRISAFKVKKLLENIN